MKKTYKINGMNCAACVRRVEQAAKTAKGVKNAEANLLLNNINIEYDDDFIDERDVSAVLKSAGYKLVINSDSNTFEEIKHLKKRLLFSIVLLIPLMYLAMGHMLKFPLPNFLTAENNPLLFIGLQGVLSLIIMVINYSYFTKGFKNIWKLKPDMDSLVASGSGAAFVYGIYVLIKVIIFLNLGNHMAAHEYAMKLYFESSGMIITLITLGKFLEGLSKGKTTEEIKKLLTLKPDTAIIIKDGKQTEIPLKEIKTGDTVVIKPGSSIPVDGVILKGFSTIDKSALTGESIPVEVKEGDFIESAGINISGYLEMRAEKVGEDTTISKIIKLVEEASSSKAPISRLADRVSGVFVPIVFSISVITFIVWMIIGSNTDNAVNFAISVLVISCPCALGLATPVAIMVGTGKGASMGILFKNAVSLEELSKVKYIALDKTGTITKGKPEIINIISYSEIPQKTLLAIAYSMELQSNHPLAKCFIERAEKENISALVIAENKYIFGKGIECIIDNDKYILGSKNFMLDNTLEINDNLEEKYQGATILYLAKNNILACAFIVKDEIKETSYKAVETLKKLGIKVVMLTGDNESSAKATAKSIGIEEYRFNILPEDKLAEIQKLQKQGLTAMVGDGINDAPSLKQADVGIAIGAGSDIALETADVLLLKNNLNDVSSAIALSHNTIRNIKQNLFWAFFYNVLCIPLAAGVFSSLGLVLNPMIAAGAMSISSIFVVLNALRIKIYK